MERKCENCEWWQQAPKDDGQFGECHRYPPIDHYDDVEYPCCVYWGLTVDDDWCGEFKEKGQ